MDHETYLAHIVEQAEAMRQAAVAAGPSAPVPTCPQWTVKDLVGHMAVVHNMAGRALITPMAEGRPEPATPPEDWTELLDWWDEQRTTLLTRLAGTDVDRDVWGFVPELASVAWWVRRQAHETAMHRLDAELARVDTVPTLLFDPDFAADGIDEVLRLSVYRAEVKRPEVTVEGSLLVHAADAGRAWVLHAEGGVVRYGPVEDSATHADANLVGTADAVYRAAWKRPSTAILSGRAEMLAAVNGG